MGFLTYLKQADFQSQLTAATLSSSSESAVYPLDNLKDATLSKTFRTTGVASEWVEVDIGATADITLIGFLNHNFTSAATLTIKGGATIGISTKIISKASSTQAHKPTPANSMAAIAGDTACPARR